MPRKRRKYNTRLVRQEYSYSIPEIAKLFGVHKNAVGQWLKSGLRPIDCSRPILVHGSALISFINNRQAARRAACQPNELYCFRCRAPRNAKDNKVSVDRHSTKVLQLLAQCCVCGLRMSKSISVKQLPIYQQVFECPTPASLHINETLKPSDNRDSTEEK